MGNGVMATGPKLPRPSLTLPTLKDSRIASIADCPRARPPEPPEQTLCAARQMAGVTTSTLPPPRTHFAVLSGDDNCTHWRGVTQGLGLWAQTWIEVEHSNKIQ